MALPTNSKLHDVFNVSLIKRYFGNNLEPLAIDIEGNEEYEIDRIVTHRRVGRGY